MNRRSFTKMLVSLLPAAWVASKVNGEPKPPVANRTCCKRCGREGDTFNSLCAQCYMGYAPGTPPEIVLADQSSFPPGFLASKGFQTVRPIADILANLDDVEVVRFVREDGRKHWVRFIVGNGYDILSDNGDDQGAFTAAIDEFITRQDELCGACQ